MYYLGEQPFHGNLLSAVYDMVSTNEQAGPPERGTEGSAIDRSLRVFGDVRAGEGRDVVFMFLNVFLLLVAYYVLKTVREPLILTAGGAELKAYAAAAQAAVLLLYVPAYGWLVSRLPRQRLILVVVLFFFGWIQLFFLAGQAGLPFIGFAFYVWVGIFSLTMIAQFWSMANDIYSKPEGDRLFPLIAIGSTAGAPLGAALAERLFAFGVSPWIMMQLAGALLLVHLGLYYSVRRNTRRAVMPAKTASAGANGFALVLQSPYLRLIALLLVLLNIVNTTGEYILASFVTDRAAELAGGTPGFDQGAFIGSFYGSYFFWVNIASVILQAFVVSRVVKYLGMAGALFALPVIAFGAYGLIAASAGLMLVRVMKTLENSTDYSVMNTAKQMLWLPTTRDQKFKAKQAIDTFFVRMGDMLAAAVVFVGTSIVSLSPGGFARVNIVVVLASMAVAWALLREYRHITQEERAKTAA
jgi:ATP:ADP antiporter, AAA family